MTRKQMAVVLRVAALELLLSVGLAWKQLQQWLRWQCWRFARGFWQAKRLDDAGERYGVRWSRQLLGGLRFYLGGEWDMRGAADIAWSLNTEMRTPRDFNAERPDDESETTETEG